ncbi:6-phosphogluconolactonase [Allorhodopirellula heiligendammensis]|uniref:6-phosphogluconolactonase n=1 Tax=Allorhodopirellula heiligendammensis TaxID=2714739 RepID=A0A5C6BHT1_9BACT|nr:6-phosphogluconolactonase [Allorhodopirellula heiligendammensis]TWU11101.1 6-phosphogluconolactonase [Allorhodopirellula heiligendammensis]
MAVSTKVLADPASLAETFAADFAAWVDAQSGDAITVALSGGSTPKRLFELWADQYADQIDWSRIQFFWGDERCVPPADPESNFGVAKQLLFDRITIPAENIHRVRGEASAEQECSRYEREIQQVVPTDQDGNPEFDLIILGMGDDGHTASIFPHQSEFLSSQAVCEVATHPQSGQQRITLTGRVLNAAKKVSVLVTGAGKADVLADVIGRQGAFAEYPVSHVEGDDVCFYIDQAAAAKL